MEKIPNRKGRLRAEPISQGDHGVPFLDESKERLDSRLSWVLACGLSKRLGSLSSKGPSQFDSEIMDHTQKLRGRLRRSRSAAFSTSQLLKGISCTYLCPDPPGLGPPQTDVALLLVSLWTCWIRIASVGPQPGW